MYQLLKAQSRPITKDSSLKELRDQDKIPAIIFGKGVDSLPISFNKVDYMKTVSHGKVFQVEIDGKGKELVSLGEVQKDVFHINYLHVSLKKMTKGQSATLALPFHFAGEAPGIKEGGIVEHKLNEVDVEGLPKDFPESITVDLSELHVSSSIHIRDIKLPATLKFKENDMDKVVAACNMPKVQAEEPDLTETEPEVEEKGKSEEAKDQGDSGKGEKKE